MGKYYVKSGGVIFECNSVKEVAEVWLGNLLGKLIIVGIMIGIVVAIWYALGAPTWQEIDDYYNSGAGRNKKYELYYETHDN